MIRVNSRIPTQILNLSLSLLKTRRTLKSTLASFPKKKSQTWTILKLTLKFNDTATHPYLNDNDMRLHSDCSRITLHRRLGAQGAKRGPKGGKRGDRLMPIRHSWGGNDEMQFQPRQVINILILSLLAFWQMRSWIYFLFTYLYFC